MQFCTNKERADAAVITPAYQAPKFVHPHLQAAVFILTLQQLKPLKNREIQHQPLKAYIITGHEILNTSLLGPEALEIRIRASD